MIWLSPGNRIYIIIIIGVDLCICLDINNNGNHNITGANLCVCPDINDNDNYNSRCEHTGSPLYKIVQWFKTMTTNDYIRNVKTNNWEPFNKKLWQRNYYEHIIRNEFELNKIRKYVQNNLLNWRKDKNYKI